MGWESFESPNVYHEDRMFLFIDGTFCRYRRSAENEFWLRHLTNKKKPNIILSQLQKCEHLLLFSALFNCKWKTLGFMLLVGQNKQFEDIILGFGKIWQVFFTMSYWLQDGPVITQALKHHLQGLKRVNMELFCHRELQMGDIWNSEWSLHKGL